MQLTVACGQMSSETLNPPANLRIAGELIQEAADCGAKLVLIPEFFTTDCIYDRKLKEFAEPIDGPTTKWMTTQSRRTGCYLGGGVLELSGDKMYNTFVMAAPSGETWSYRKQNPAFFEKFYFHAGRKPGIFNTPLGRIGVLICWDMVHKRMLQQLRGRCDMLLISAAWPDMTTGNYPVLGFQGWMSRQPDSRPPFLARELQVPVMFCNSTGDFSTRVPGLGLTYRSQYAGGTAIYSADGQTLNSLGQEQALVTASIQPGRLSRTPAVISKAA